MGPKWRRHPDQRPTDIARAALEVAAERGVLGTRVADIALRAGVTVGTIYRYFPDKDAVLDAALALAVPPAPRQPLGDRPGSVIPALSEALRRWGGFFDGAGARAVRVTLSEPRRAAANASGPVASALSELAELVREGVARGELRRDLDPQAVARALVGALALGTATSDAVDHALLEVVAALATRGLRPDAVTWKTAP